MDLFQGGDLRYHLCLRKKFTELETKFFISCLLLSLQYIHSKNIIHRDIKPENLVLDSNGYLALTDFGVASRKTRDNSNETSGTPGYMAPEVLCAQNHSFPVDFFAIGIMGYEFMTGKRPYLGRNRKEIKEAVFSKQAHVHRRDAFVFGWSVDSCDFINRMIVRKPSKRLGYNGILEIKQHPWLKYFNWKDLYLQKINPPYSPDFYERMNDSYYYPTHKKGLKTIERYMKIKKSQKYLNEFKLYEYYDRRKDQNIKNLIEEDNILIDNDSSQNDNVNRNNKEMKNTTSLFNTNKS
jgi:serine/threonine protein kinase